jgi:hypothetical protein
MSNILLAVTMLTDSLSNAVLTLTGRPAQRCRRGY